VEAADPEVVVIAPCGYDAPRAAAEAARVLARPEWAWARGRAVWALDANALVSRPGPRLVDGVEALAALLAPSLFPPPPADQAVQVVAAAPG
jgi:iron complex transport system substrate-binding protein